LNCFQKGRISTFDANFYHRYLQTEPLPGDTFYVLHYDAEGYWKVWFHNKITYVHQSIMDVPQPKAEWWVKIKDSKGKIGWALSHGNFEHQDSCE
jgi:hypothetical protein